MSDPALRGVVAVGASAGGVEALKDFVAGLPEGFGYAVLVALHTAPGSPGVLGRILDRCGPLSAATAHHGEPLRPGRVYVAVPDRHIMVDDRRVVLSRGPSEGRHRPAINPLFRSVALHHGPRGVGIVLSGVLDDGVSGLGAVHDRGGLTVVQDPDEALYSDMPLNALAAVPVDHTLKAAEMGAMLSNRPWPLGAVTDLPPDPSLEMEQRIAMGSPYASSGATQLGPPSGYSCPDCNGGLVEVGPGNYRCRVGHAWTPNALFDAWDSESENALSMAVRSLEEKARLARHLAGTVSPGMLQRRYAEIADEGDAAVEVLRARLDRAREEMDGE
ncbi:chemotaxis protein CheB [Mycolicibacterium grossiae]|uniref:protein-glutamate methylesterase n=1 Tax=Mycolicibacterium grossiae TaxID=1552759 RepID=A0A1E8Q3U4_9MYCO|nr:chemotaxis protein CheB [Mycolicibacterium grossiae]OFJ53253.1 chemotaxis protein CheB [Mycolicibacterium grossiae]QEM45059.1 chemotaxis protein CheB [Mycolicibacterium grossiae]